MKKSYIKSSILYMACTQLMNYYNTSLLKKITRAVEKEFRQSSVLKAYNRYVERRPAFEHAFSYKALAAAGRTLDRPVGYFSRKLRFFWKESLPGKITGLYTCRERPGIFRLLSAVAVFYAIGFTAGILIKHSWSLSSAILVLLLLAGSQLLYLAGDKIEGWYKNSCVCRLYKYIFD